MNIYKIKSPILFFHYKKALIYQDFARNQRRNKYETGYKAFYKHTESPKSHQYVRNFISGRLTCYSSRLLTCRFDKVDF